MTGRCWNLKSIRQWNFALVLLDFLLSSESLALSQSVEITNMFNCVVENTLRTAPDIYVLSLDFILDIGLLLKLAILGFFQQGSLLLVVAKWDMVHSVTGKRLDF